jgi:hypothetical protein
LIQRVSEFITTYDDRGKIGRFAGRKQLAEEIDEFTRELNSFGARFAVRIGYITPSHTLTVFRITVWWICI